MHSYSCERPELRPEASMTTAQELTHHVPCMAGTSCTSWKRLQHFQGTAEPPCSHWQPHTAGTRPSNLVLCKVQHLTYKKPREMPGKEPQQHFFLERRKPFCCKSLYTTHLYLNLASSTYVSLHLWTLQAAETRNTETSRMPIHKCL